ncbi:hypothetical protein SRABI84_02679 [Peribacillus simplex]|nr:hypothetical protein SRABI84_02679 [Peribacillus simplex]
MADMKAKSIAGEANKKVKRILRSWKKVRGRK